MTNLHIRLSNGARRVCLVALLGMATGAVAMPAAFAEPVPSRRLLEVEDLGNPVISPDGRYVAFRSERASVERNRYESTWYVQRLDGTSLPRRVAEGGEPLRQYISSVVLPSPAVWSLDGRWIYYRARIDGRVSIWRAAADGGGAGEVVSDPADVRDFALSGDSRTLYYSVGATREEVLSSEMLEYDNGVRIDDSVMIAGSLFRSSRIDGRPTTQRFLGGWAPTGPLLSNVPDRWKAVDLSTKTLRDWSDEAVPGSADLPAGVPTPSKLAEHPDDGRVALLLQTEIEDDGLLLSPLMELAVLADGRSPRLIRCEAALCRRQVITDIRWRPASDEVLFTVTEYSRGRTQSIHRWNVVTGEVLPVVVSDGLVSGSQRHWDVPCAVSATTMVCVAAEADRPPRLEAIDVDSGQRRRLFEPNNGLELDIAASAPARLIRWTDERGREFTGHLFEARIADEDNAPPLFVTFYNCYGFLRGGLGDEWPLATLAGHGISSLCINAIAEFRLDFIERHDQGRLAVESVVAYLSAEGRIDPARVGMGGLSYGSEVTLWTLAQSDVVAAASVSGASPTPTDYLFNSLREDYRSGLRQSWQLGAPDETPERWRQISPVFHLDRIRAPVLFQLPEQEFRLVLDYALPLVQRHQGDIYVFPEEAHIKFQPRHKLAVYERNLDWFRFWLQGQEDPDPNKVEQYAHWRAMRDGVGDVSSSATMPVR